MESTKRVREKGWPLPLRRQVDQTIHLLNEQEWIVQLLVRVFVGYFFMESGWGKLHNLDGFARRFAGWGLPLAALQRRLVRIHRVYWGSAYYLRDRHAVGVDTDDNQHVGSDSHS
jgi:hypothetical protein